MGEKSNEHDINEIIKNRLEMEYVEDSDEFVFEGSQKLSLPMLVEMGKMGVSKVEFNTLIWLARHQNKQGQVFCNVHMLKTGIGISDSYFPWILYKLKEKGLIEFTRTAEWRKNKNGIYKIELPYNNFAEESKTYIRIGHKLFQTKKFYELPVAGKYILLMAAYELRWLSREDIERKGKCVAAINYWDVHKNCRRWAGLSKRTVSEGFRIVKGLFTCRMQRNYNKDGQIYQALSITLKKEDTLFACSDNYALYTNLLCGVLEEEGSPLAKMLQEQGDLEHVADLVIRHEGKAKELVHKARNDYKKGALIRKGQALSRNGAGTKKEFEDIRNYTRPFQDLVRKTVTPARKFGVAGYSEAVNRWDFRLAKGSVLKEGRVALWFRYLASEAVSAFRWLSEVASYKELDLAKVNIKNTVNEFMNMLMYGNIDSFGYVVKKIELRAKPAA